eukprot:4043435-Prorocentrum_lima.AAC.1
MRTCSSRVAPLFIVELVALPFALGGGSCYGPGNVQRLKTVALEDISTCSSWHLTRTSPNTRVM